MAINKYRLRAFSIGLAFAVGVIGTYYFFFLEKEVINTHQPTIEEAKQIISKHGLVVLSEEDLTDLTETKEKYLKQQEREKNTQKEPEPKQTISYTIKIKTGMTNEEIADLLEDNGIIENKRDFIDYMAINGYSKSIQIGSFTITDEMTLEDIAKALTESK